MSTYYPPETRYIALILLHADEDHELSAEIIQRVKDSGTREITLIEVSDCETRDWLLHNEKKVRVSTLPSFLVVQTGKATQVYPASAVDYILNLARQIEAVRIL